MMLGTRWLGIGARAPQEGLVQQAAEVSLGFSRQEALLARGALRLVDRVIREVLAVGANPGVGRVGAPGLGSVSWWDVVLHGRPVLFSLSTTIRRVELGGEAVGSLTEMVPVGGIEAVAGRRHRQVHVGVAAT